MAITTFGELKKAIAAAEQNGLSDNALVSVEDNTTGEQYRIGEALNYQVDTTSPEGKVSLLEEFYISIQLIME